MSLTEREHVWIGYCDLCNGQHCITIIKDADAKVARRPHIHLEVRAALRERDAAWFRAFDGYVLEGTEPMCRHCSGLLRDSLDLRKCEGCAPLRALLEEAGK